VFTINGGLLATGKSQKNGIFATVHRTGAETRATELLNFTEVEMHKHFQTAPLLVFQQAICGRWFSSLNLADGALGLRL